MCGIAGYVGPRAGECVDRVHTMLQSIAHRGPDNEGLWQSEDVVLGHRRLSIIDTSASGNQPMVSVSGRYVLVYNGEIYNLSLIHIWSVGLFYSLVLWCLIYLSLRPVQEFLLDVC